MDAGRRAVGGARAAVGPGVVGVLGVLGVLAVLAVAGCAGLTGTSGAAACASPVATASPAEVAPGGEVTLSVDGLMSDCYDTGQGGPNPPLRHADLVLVSGDGWRSDVLATVDAGKDLHVEVTFTVPADAPAGPASVRIGTIPFDVLTVTG